MKKSKKTPAALEVAIIGLHHLHPRSYMALFASLPTTRAVAVVDPDGALRLPFAKEFGLQEFETVPAMLAAVKPDIAAIFLPHADCPAAAAACAKAGAHLMVEKPMAASRAGAEKIVAAARAAGVKTTTGYCWRLHPVAREIRKLVASGVLGDIVGAEARCAAGRLTRYIDGHSEWMLDPRRSGGGPMYNLGVHWIDLLRWMLQDEVVAVSGQNVKVNRQYGIEDNSFAHLRYRRGTIAALDISYTVPDAFPYGRDLYISLRGTRGTVSWAPAYEGEKDILNICSDDPAFGGSPRRSQAFELERTPGYSGFMGREYVRAFADAILTNKTPPITGEDGVAALRVVEAVYRSAKAKRWVEVQS
jgi:predicted dehydrogenase